MRNLCLVPILASLTAVGPLGAQVTASLEAALRARIARDTATVSVAFLDPERRQEVLLDGLRRYHAASTMKIPVLMELARRVDAGEFGWADTLPVRNRFTSIVDGSPFSLDPADDSDSSLYAEAAVPIAELARRMIARSSNLATNLLIQRLDPSRVNRTAHEFGADSIHVLRGVEDGKAYARGLNNTTTARDLAVLLEAIATGRVASPAATDSMLGFLLAQEFNRGIPAGLPPGVRVAHKTGWITAIAHDAAIVYPPGRGAYVLVILTRGFAQEADAERLMADLSGIVYRWATAPPPTRD
ncbi:MAG TPA: serine hydrolase [Gemmatimonadales bacterium]|nr:serine hydrolase [Gemmatimonadales bacterium]